MWAGIRDLLWFGWGAWERWQLQMWKLLMLAWVESVLRHHTFQSVEIITVILPMLSNGAALHELYRVTEYPPLFPFLGHLVSITAGFFIDCVVKILLIWFMIDSSGEALLGSIFQLVLFFYHSLQSRVENRCAAILIWIAFGQQIDWLAWSSELVWAESCGIGEELGLSFLYWLYSFGILVWEL